MGNDEAGQTWPSVSEQSQEIATLSGLPAPAIITRKGFSPMATAVFSGSRTVEYHQTTIL
jgi:hypothetical protein